MTGRFDLNLGEDYGFFPKRAKEVAEAAQGGGGSTGTISLPQGPFQTQAGINYWLGTGPGNSCWVGFDVDADPAPDVWTPLISFMNNPTVDQQSKDDVMDRANDIGCGA